MNNLSSRIPLSLQAVFLSSNRGHEVHQPPPDSSAFKMFKRFSRKRSARDQTTVKPTNDADDTSNSTTTSNVSSNRKKLVDFVKNKQHAATPKAVPVEEPQDVLDSLLHPRKYDTTPYASMNTAYCFTPSPLQRASYTTHLQGLVRENHIQAFSDIIDSGLVSNNPCNQFSESLLHMTARKGQVDQARALIRNGASTQVCDDYGRTPMHDLCWCPKADASVFELADILLQQDSRLFYIKDKRGNLPLDYVKDPANKQAWVAFLKSKVDVYWPTLAQRQGRPPLCLKKPNSGPVTEPKMATNMELAAVVASGQLDASDSTGDSDSEDEDDTESPEDDDDEDDDSESESEMDFDDDELLNDMAYRMKALNC